MGLLFTLILYVSYDTGFCYFTINILNLPTRSVIYKEINRKPLSRCYRLEMAESHKSIVLACQKMQWCHHPSRIGHICCLKICHHNHPWRHHCRYFTTLLCLLSFQPSAMVEYLVFDAFYLGKLRMCSNSLRNGVLIA
jgi:hypothetical protein